MHVRNAVSHVTVEATGSSETTHVPVSLNNLEDHSGLQNTVYIITCSLEQIHLTRKINIHTCK
jgi:hypothetical protein